MITALAAVDEIESSQRQRAGELLDWLRTVSSDEREAVKAVLAGIGRDNGQRKGQ